MRLLIKADWWVLICHPLLCKPIRCPLATTNSYPKYFPSLDLFLVFLATVDCQRLVHVFQMRIDLPVTVTLCDQSLVGLTFTRGLPSTFILESQSMDPAFWSHRHLQLVVGDYFGPSCLGSTFTLQAPFTPSVQTTSFSPEGYLSEVTVGSIPLHLIYGFSLQSVVLLTPPGLGDFWLLI